MSSAKIKLVGLLLLALALTGCGSKIENETAGDQASAGVLLATVGDVEIKSAYYEDRLAIMEPAELPKGPKGEALDFLDNEGKKKFIDVLVNKELLVLEARAQGYHERPETAYARGAFLENEADELFWAEINKTPIPAATTEEIDTVYASLGKNRNCYFLVTNLEKDALAAYEMAMSGAEWEDVVAKYHDGNLAPDDGMPEVNVPFGRYNEAFDAMVYGIAVGEVSHPVDTGLAYWMVKVLTETRDDQPSREELEPQIVDLIKRRKMSKIHKKYSAEIDAAHKMVLNEESLLIAFYALPEGEGTIDPVTNKPIPRDELNPMNLDPAQEDLVLYSYEIDGEPVVMTLGQYKTEFDAGSVFVRAKKSGLLGGMRTKIIADMEKIIMANQAKMDGWQDDPTALAKVKTRIDQIITMALFNDSVTYEDTVTDEARDAFWADHAQDYFVPEVRTGQQVVCRNKKLAAEAALLAADGESWDAIMDKYDTDQDNKLQKGNFTVTENEGSPLKIAVFALAETGDVSVPFALESGKYVVTKLGQVYPRRDDVAMAEVIDGLDPRIIGLRQEAAFQGFLAGLRDKFPVVVYDDNLGGLKGWRELYDARVAAENPVR